MKGKGKEMERKGKEKGKELEWKRKGKGTQAGKKDTDTKNGIAERKNLHR